MRKLIGAFAITAAAITTTAAFAENPSVEQRARLAKLWAKETTVATKPADTKQNFTGIISTFRDYTVEGWTPSFRGGRAHPPAGR